MREELPESITIDEAVGFLLNIDYTYKSKDVIEMLENFEDEAKRKFGELEDPEEAQLALYLSDIHTKRISYARSVITYLEAELSSAERGEPSLLKIDANSFGNIKIISTSLHDWADHNGFGIDRWELPAFWREPPRRNYFSEYLNVIDDVIRTFCEPTGKRYDETQMSNGGGPKVADVKRYISEKYPKVSDKILGPLATIVRKGFTG